MPATFKVKTDITHSEVALNKLNTLTTKFNKTLKDIKVNTQDKKFSGSIPVLNGELKKIVDITKRAKNNFHLLGEKGTQDLLNLTKRVQNLTRDMKEMGFNDKAVSSARLLNSQLRKMKGDLRTQLRMHKSIHEVEFRRENTVRRRVEKEKIELSLISAIRRNESINAGGGKNWLRQLKMQESHLRGIETRVKKIRDETGLLSDVEAERLLSKVRKIRASTKNPLEQKFRPVQRNLIRTRQLLLTLGAVIAGITLPLALVTRSASEAEKALNSLGREARVNGVSGRQATNSVKNLKLVKDGILSLSAAARATKLAMRIGLNLDEAIATVKNMTAVAIENKQAALTLNQAVVNAFEGFKQELSTLADAAGITKNISIIYKEYADSIGTTVAKLNKSQKAHAIMNEVQLEATKSAGALEDAQFTLSGSIDRSRGSVEIFSQELGLSLSPVIQLVLDGFTSVVKSVTQFIADNSALIRSISAATLAFGVFVATLVALAAALLVIGSIISFGAVIGALFTTAGAAGTLGVSLATLGITGTNVTGVFAGLAAIMGLSGLAAGLMDEKMESIGRTMGSLKKRIRDTHIEESNRNKVLKDALYLINQNKEFTLGDKDARLGVNDALRKMIPNLDLEIEARTRLKGLINSNATDYEELARQMERAVKAQNQHKIDELRASTKSQIKKRVEEKNEFDKKPLSNSGFFSGGTPLSDKMSNKLDTVVGLDIKKGEEYTRTGEMPFKQYTRKGRRNLIFKYKIKEKSVEELRQITNDIDTLISNLHVKEEANIHGTVLRDNIHEGTAFLDYSNAITRLSESTGLSKDMLGSSDTKAWLRDTSTVIREIIETSDALGADILKLEKALKNTSDKVMEANAERRKLAGEIESFSSAQNLTDNLPTNPAIAKDSLTKLITSMSAFIKSDVDKAIKTIKSNTSNEEEEELAKTVKRKNTERLAFIKKIVGVNENGVGFKLTKEDFKMFTEADSLMNDFTKLVLKQFKKQIVAIDDLDDDFKKIKKSSSLARQLNESDPIQEQQKKIFEMFKSRKVLPKLNDKAVSSSDDLIKFLKNEQEASAKIQKILEKSNMPSTVTKNMMNILKTLVKNEKVLRKIAGRLRGKKQKALKSILDTLSNGGDRTLLNINTKNSLLEGLELVKGDENKVAGEDGNILQLLLDSLIKSIENKIPYVKPPELTHAILAKIRENNNEVSKLLDKAIQFSTSQLSGVNQSRLGDILNEKIRNSLSEKDLSNMKEARLGLIQRIKSSFKNQNLDLAEILELQGEHLNRSTLSDGTTPNEVQKDIVKLGRLDEAIDKVTALNASVGKLSKKFKETTESGLKAQEELRKLQYIMRQFSLLDGNSTKKKEFEDVIKTQISKLVNDIAVMREVTSEFKKEVNQGLVRQRRFFVGDDFQQNFKEKTKLIEKIYQEHLGRLSAFDSDYTVRKTSLDEAYKEFRISMENDLEAKQIQVARNTHESVKNSFGTFMSSVLEDAHNLSDALYNLGKSLVDRMNQLMVERILTTNLFQNIIGGVAGGVAGITAPSSNSFSAMPSTMGGNTPVGSIQKVSPSMQRIENNTFNINAMDSSSFNTFLQKRQNRQAVVGVVSRESKLMPGINDR